MAIDPTHTDLGQLLSQIEQLPEQDQKQLVNTLSQKFNNGSVSQDAYVPLKTGWAKDLITIGPDFDEPLDDFKEYME